MNAKNITALGFLIIVTSFGYYFLIFLPSKHKAEQELEKEKFNAEIQFKTDQEQKKVNNLESCLKNANDDYLASWNLNCPKFGINKKEGSCSLPDYISLSLDEGYKQDQELCIKKYK